MAWIVQVNKADGKLHSCKSFPHEGMAKMYIREEKCQELSNFATYHRKRRDEVNNTIFKYFYFSFGDGVICQMKDRDKVDKATDEFCTMINDEPKFCSYQLMKVDRL